MADLQSHQLVNIRFHLNFHYRDLQFTILEQKHIVNLFSEPFRSSLRIFKLSGHHDRYDRYARFFVPGEQRRYYLKKEISLERFCIIFLHFLTAHAKLYFSRSKSVFSG